VPAQTFWCCATPLDWVRGQGPLPKLDCWHSPGAAGLECFVVTQTREGLWSASYDGETFATYTTEEEALSRTLKRAAERRRVGIKTVVIITRETKDGICETIPSKDET
jgi:hypothetical protein